MSWQEQLATKLTITTGDGKKYYPKWKPTGKDVEYNVAEFTFPNVEGSLVKRNLPKGKRHNFDLYFDGENHLDQLSDFELSAANPKPWTVEHPYYGTLLVQPMGLSFDNVSYNVTHITGAWIETITEDAPLAKISVPDKVLGDKAALDSIMADAYAADVSPKAIDIKEMSDKTSNTYKQGVKGISNTIDSTAYMNAFRDANKAINNAVADPLMAIRQVQAMINAPFQFATGVQIRVKTLIAQLTLLGSSIATILTRNSKKLYENNAGAMMSSLMAATVTNATYSTRKEAVDTIEALIGAWSGYVTNLDALQSINGGVADSYMPDAESLIKLSNLVSFTISVLLQEASNAKQERSLFLEEDSNVMNLTKRFYGMQMDDSTLDYFIDTNAIGLDELLVVAKGRKIIYYV